ncbi:unnamed protein product [Ectocarpus sp. 6 AP-2014]
MRLSRLPLIFGVLTGSILVCFPSAVPAESTQPDHLTLDWSEWIDPPVAPVTDNWATSSMEALLTTPCVDAAQTGGCHQLRPAQVRTLVHDCARRLKVAGDLCGHSETPVVEDDYRLPHMESGVLPCGFEERTPNEVLEDMASKFTFHFIGDSTIRRLGESFVSIFTGQGSKHEMVHSDLDFSTGNLETRFYWAPFCFGPESVGAKLATVMDGVQTAKRGDKRSVIITAFGVHDSYELPLLVKGSASTSYMDALPPDFVDNGSVRTATLGACQATTAQLVQAAAAKVMAWADPTAEKGQLSKAVHASPNTTTRSTTETNGVSFSFGAPGTTAATDPTPPLVFLMQNNRYPPNSPEDNYLEELRRIQRGEVQEWEAGEGNEDAEGGIYLVDDSVSLFRNLSCYRESNPIHFHEPVKLVEGKMLWDLLALVERESASPLVP